MEYDYPYSENSYGQRSDVPLWEKVTPRTRDRRQTRRGNINSDNTYSRASTQNTFHPDYDPESRQIRRVTFQQVTEKVEEKAPVYWSLVRKRIIFLADHIVGNLLFALPLDIFLLYGISSTLTSINFRYLIFNIPAVSSVMMTLMSLFVIEVNFLAIKFSWWLMLANAAVAIVVAIGVAWIVGPPLGLMLGLGTWRADGSTAWIIERFGEFLRFRSYRNG